MDGIARRDRDGWFVELPVGPSLVSHWRPPPVLQQVVSLLFELGSSNPCSELSKQNFNSIFLWNILLPYLNYCHY
jgi:hypothetical protein